MHINTIHRWNSYTSLFPTQNSFLNSRLEYSPGCLPPPLGCIVDNSDLSPKLTLIFIQTLSPSPYNQWKLLPLVVQTLKSSYSLLSCNHQEIILVPLSNSTRIQTCLLLSPWPKKSSPLTSLQDLENLRWFMLLWLLETLRVLHLPQSKSKAFTYKDLHSPVSSPLSSH